LGERQRAKCLKATSSCTKKRGNSGNDSRKKKKISSKRERQAVIFQRPRGREITPKTLGSGWNAGGGFEKTGSKNLSDIMDERSSTGLAIGSQERGQRGGSGGGGETRRGNGSKPLLANGRKIYYQILGRGGTKRAKQGKDS